MQIAVLGAGTMGRAMSALLTSRGHTVILGTRSAAFGARTIGTLAGELEARSYRDATAAAELVVLTTPWELTHAAVTAAGPLEQRILIDCTNPEASNGRSLAVGLTTSGAEQVAAWATGARVVKAFNHVYAEVLSSRHAFAGGLTLLPATIQRRRRRCRRSPDRGASILSTRGRSLRLATSSRWRCSWSSWCAVRGSGLPTSRYDSLGTRASNSP